MLSFYFWKSWLKDYRVVWYLSGGLFLLTLIFLWYSYLQGPSGVIEWSKLQEQKVIESTVHQFRLGPFELSIPGESYVILEYFNGGNITPNTSASYFFLFALIASAVVILTVITTIERFWFFVAMGLFIVFVVSLRLEVLGIFGLTNKLPTALTLVLFVVPAFYFNRFSRTTSFLVRLLVLSTITAIVALVINFASSVDEPFFHLAMTGYAPGLVLSVLFIIMIAHEILASFIYVVSQGSSKSLRHFSLICVIYMTNVIITCLHELGVIDWNFVYINPYLLLSLSGILGIWGFRQRETLYQNILPFAPFGAYFFVALGAICFATTGQLLGNSNDPALKIIRDAVLFSHVGYGIVFLTYVFANFIDVMGENLPVSRVLYNPARMPYFTYRFAGLIATLGFVFYSNWHEYVFHGLAGFYNNAGDLYTLLDNEPYAEVMYAKGQSQGFLNNRSNYALASIEASQLSLAEAHLDYERANGKRPTQFSLANAGNLYVWEGDLTNAIAEYKKALKAIPSSKVLENNLGFAYAKQHKVDSSIIYLSAARENSLTRNSAETNFLALATLEHISIKTDSVLKLFGNSSAAVMGNAIALTTSQGLPFNTTVDPLAEKRLNLFSATLLNNYVIKNAKSLDTTFIKQAYAIAADSLNSPFSEVLKTSLAFGYYHQGNVAKALEILAEQAYVTQSYQGKFNYIQGLWALEQGNPELASSYFTFADTYDYKEAKFYNAIALTESGRVREAFIAWDSIGITGLPQQQVIASHMKRILTMPISEVLTIGDAEKYQFCRYRIGLRDSIDFNRLVNTFENVNYKAQALLDISGKYYHADKIGPAIRFYNRIAGLELTDKTLFETVRHTELLMLASRKEIRSIATQINKGVAFDASRALEKSLYTALIAEASGDSTTARKHYDILGVYNPYLEEAIIAAATFFSKHDKGLKAYNTLAEAIQINANSIRLLKAYIEEANRVGFDEYALSASQRLQELQQNLP